MNIIFIGPPGAGKGTQAKVLQSEFGILPVSTGDILRQAVEMGTEMGKKAQAFMSAGELVPDEVVIGIIKDRIREEDAQNGFILDGFPRTVPQAEALAVILRENGLSIDHVVLFEADTEELTSRMIKRAEEQGRSDDTPETIKNRLGVYTEKTKPLIDFYRTQGVLMSVDGLGQIEEVSRRLIAALKP